MGQAQLARSDMEAKSIDADGIFKLLTTCPNDPRTLILDVRPHKEFKKKHINQAYCVRVSSNQQVLADYSQSSYSLPWSQHCWWGKPVVVYGPAGVGKDHPVVKFLTAEGRCTSVQYFKPGCDAFEKDYPFLCTSSVKANSIKKYPSMILPRFLYLGDWADAQQHERLKEIGIKRLVTIHNHPDRLQVLPGVRHLKIELADVEGADISPHFNAVYEFLSEAERLKQPTLVHCGAGVSRSACLVMMYLMRSRLWSAQKSRDYCIAARSLVCPNDGFWRVLCALEGPLGILDRSDPEATMGFAGADAPAKLDTKAAGLPVTVKMITAAELKQQQQEEEAAKAAAAAAAARAAEEQQRRESEAAAVAVAAVAAEDADHSPEQGGDQMPKLQRGRSRNRNRSTSSSSSSGSDSSTSTSSTSSDGSSSSDTSSSDDSSSSSSSDEELQQRSRSRDVDRSKKRHRSSSRDRAAAAAAARQEHSAAAAAAGDSRKRRKTHSSSRSRSPERPKLRRGSGEGRDRRDGGDDSADRQRGSSPSNHQSSRAKFKSRSPLRRGGGDRRTSRSRSRERDSRDQQQQQQGRSNSRARDRRDRLAQGRDPDRKDRGSDRDRNRHREREGDRTRPDSSSRGELRGDQAAANAANGRGAADDRAQQQFPAPPAAAAGNAAAGEPAAPAAAAAKGQSGWLVKLEVSKPEGLVGQLVLGPMNIHQRVVFGRAPSCNVVMEHLSVSRQHAQLSVDLAGTVNVMDMGAAHGTKLNDTWIKAQQPRAMPVGSQLRFGASTRVYTLISVEKI